MEPPYSRAAHGHNAWDPEWIEERFSVMLQCNLASCGEVVVMAGETQIDQVVNDDGDGWAYEQMLEPKVVFTPASRSRIAVPPPDQLPLLDLTTDDVDPNRTSACHPSYFPAQN
jgi:hypothetical protein